MTLPCMLTAPPPQASATLVPCSSSSSIIIIKTARSCSGHRKLPCCTLTEPSSCCLSATTQTKPLHTHRASLSSRLRPRCPKPLNTQRKHIKCCTVPPLPRYNGNAAPNPDVLPAERQDTPRPPRPTRIILIRHGQSEGNVDESAYTRIPDSQIALTETGWKQALRCGKAIREMIESDGIDDWSVYFYVSPYKRTLQTLRGIGRAFDRERIAGVREEPRLREQDFGNFQDREKMLKQKEQRARYGRFFYRFPNGESAADVYDRLTGFRETLRADIDLGRFQRPEARSRNMNLVIVSHGLALRIFLMRWYKWTVRQFEALNNFSNAGVFVMQLGDHGRYSLLVHHTRQELKDFGLTDSMIEDQEWQKSARIGELNYDWITSGPSFFTHFDKQDEQINNGAVPPDVVKTTL